MAKESVLRSIPREYIDSARSTLHIAYQHTSHGTHVSRGVFGLQDFEDGDQTFFSITNNSPTPNKLDFRDYALSSYAEAGIDAADLSRIETAFIQATLAVQSKKISSEVMDLLIENGADVNAALTGSDVSGWTALL